MKDDYKHWEDQVNVIASKNLDTFSDAVKSGNRGQLYEALNDLKGAVEDAYKNNLRLGKVLGGFVNTIKTLSTGSSLTRLARMNVIRLMAKAIDGNRDNKSYFLLEAAREWLERRLPLAEEGSELKNQMKELLPKVIAARDTLDGMAQSFVNGVKKMITLTENSRENKDAIAELANDLAVNGQNSKKLEQEGKDALEVIERMYKQASTM